MNDNQQCGACGEGGGQLSTATVKGQKRRLCYECFNELVHGHTPPDEPIHFAGNTMPSEPLADRQYHGYGLTFPGRGK